jgi:hypothetical protein
MTMTTETIEKVVKDVEDALNIKLKKVARKFKIFDGKLLNGQSILLITPESSILRGDGYCWIDITEIQRELASAYFLVLIAFRLPDKNTLFVDFKQLSLCLSDKAKLYNEREKYHWKLHIWSYLIKVQGGNKEFIIKQNYLQQVAKTL